jgi:hypothetical protein
VKAEGTSHHRRVHSSRPLVGRSAPSLTNRPDQLRRSGIFVVARPPRSRLKLRRSAIAAHCQQDAAPLGLKCVFLGHAFYKDTAPAELAASRTQRRG